MRLYYTLAISACVLVGFRSDIWHASLVFGYFVEAVIYRPVNACERLRVYLIVRHSFVTCDRCRRGTPYILCLQSYISIRQRK